MVESVSHYAFSDESGYNIGKYQSIGLITIPTENFETFKTIFTNICSKHGFNDLTKVKWHALRSADLRFCVQEIMELVIKYAIDKGLRIDVLIWDTQDSRHSVQGRDDSKNLAIMYYHLIKNVFMKRWPEGSEYLLFPDRNNSIDWEKLFELLEHKGLILSYSKPDELGRVGINLKRKYKLKIIESTPPKSPLIQLADLFAGMGSYSRDSFEKWEIWKRINDGQTCLVPFKEEKPLSRRHKERCLIMNSFKNNCDKNKLGVSLKSTKGFKTFDPTNPINFWFYKPQHKKDKAPTL